MKSLLDACLRFDNNSFSIFNSGNEEDMENLLLNFIFP